MQTLKTHIFYAIPSDAYQGDPCPMDINNLSYGAPQPEKYNLSNLDWREIFKACNENDLRLRKLLGGGLGGGPLNRKTPEQLDSHKLCGADLIPIGQ